MKGSIEGNYEIFLKKMVQLGIDAEMFNEKYGDKLKNGSFTNTNEYSMSYDGSLLDIVLRTLTPYAVKINDLLPLEMRIPKDKLVKVCLLHRISKCVRLVKNDNQWEVEKRGILYKYNDSNPSIRTGLQSLMMAMECGVQFSIDEVEAMTSIDRDLTDTQSRFHSNTLSTIIRQANELTYTEFKERK